MEHVEHANELTFHTFVFSTDPGWWVGLHFATVGGFSGQMSVEVATRDIWGCDSWRKGRVGPKTKSAVVMRQKDKTKTRETPKARDRHGDSSRRARRKYKGRVRDARSW